MELFKLLLLVILTQIKIFKNVFAATINLSSMNINEYNRMRQEILQENQARGLGFDEPLSSDELKLNKIIMEYKKEELIRGFIDPNNFSAARHYFEVVNEVNKSPLFQLLKKMPKAGVLHAHDTALASTDYVVTLTYWDNLWQCGNVSQSLRFLFSMHQPPPIARCSWILVSEERSRLGADVYDYHVRKLFTLFVDNPREVYYNINQIWEKFEDIFQTIGPIVTYVPIWKKYFYQSLLEFYEDGVSILEFRGILPTVRIL